MQNDETVSMQQALGAFARLDANHHVNREMARELWKRGELTHARLDYIENAPYGVSYEAWRSRK